MSVPEHRSQNFKAKTAFKPEELRRNRNELNVELRKQKREENLSKRRNLAIAADSEESEDENVAAANLEVSSFS
jgi:importin subunit alpha-1